MLIILGNLQSIVDRKVQMSLKHIIFSYLGLENDQK